ncbi:uncharacterized protein LOC143352647 [Halictus rubicundus]|uniref:uncharacterized protein LOC143352647 n=1 Tax=Halictus rubicundus TaxID=77578 RepID=UPI004036261F
MNFVLIPFFLAASVMVDDPSKWQYGLVAHFHANITFSWGTTEDSIESKNLSTVFTCRQSSIDELMCSSPRVLMYRPQFLVKFNKNGIENLSFQVVLARKQLSLIRAIMKELSVGVNLLQHANALSAFVANENYILGDCSTLFTVLQEVGASTFSNFDEKRNYELNVLSMPYRKYGANVIIEKRTNSNWCNRTNYDDGSSPTSIFISKKSVTKIHIGVNTFVSLNKLTAKGRKLKDNQSFITEMITQVALVGIEPATEELPSLDAPHKVMLSSSNMIHNFVEK